MPECTPELVDARLVENLPLAYHAAMSVVRHMNIVDDEQFEDAKSGAVLGMVEGDRRFDPSKGTKWSTWVWWWARSRAQDAMEKQGAVTRGIDAKEKPKYTDLEVDGVVYAAHESDEEEILGRVAVESLMSVLTPKQYRAIEMYYGIGCGGVTMNITEIGVALGICRQAVQCRIQGGLERMRNTTC